MAWGKTEQELALVVTNQAFFPNVTLGDLQRDYRVAAEHEPETVVHHLSLAMIETNEALACNVTRWKADGFNTLVAVDADVIGAEGAEVSVLVFNYLRAVFCKTKALLMQQYASMYQRDIDSKKEQNPGYWISEYNAAVRSFSGVRSRIDCEAL